jgi:hypothetical protein
LFDYRCRFLKKNDVLVGQHCFQCESDGEAHDHALGLLIGHPPAEKVEVWKNARLSFSYTHLAEQTPGELRKLCDLAIAAAKKVSDKEMKLAIAWRAVALAQEAELLERRADTNGWQ